MASLELNAEIYRTLGEIAEDENLLKRALKSLKRLAAKKQDETLMTKEEFFARVDEAREQIRCGECYEMMPNESYSEFRKRIGNELSDHFFPQGPLMTLTGWNMMNLKPLRSS